MYGRSRSGKALIVAIIGRGGIIVSLLLLVPVVHVYRMFDDFMLQFPEVVPEAMLSESCYRGD
jgi:hypothetical protein